MGPHASDQKASLPTGPASLADEDGELMERAVRVAKILAANWRRGHYCPAEELLAENPCLLGHPRAAVRVVYEEICQRQERGQDVSLTALRERFPQWQDQLKLALECQRLLGLAPRGTFFPTAGEALGEFRILAELGRGGRGRVYLAEQTFLAGRLTVLKVTPCGDQEHLNLARLQHTHIVPLFSVRDHPDRNLRELCMPCLGGATLQQLLRQLHQVPPEQRTGRNLLTALREGTADPRLYWPAQGPNRRFLEQASYVQAVCWIGVCLADALHYAHEQGLVHLDLKPANVLLTADCQPMLLDFHLARGPIRPHADGPQWLGGTPGYMSPEQHDAWRCCSDQKPVTVAVDERSDIYALGLLLREALYGELLPASQSRAGADPPPRPDISPGLRSVLGRCLRPDPAARYPSAALLAEDLRRHLTNRPLAGVRNRSLAERWRKWRRRQPQALWLGLLVAVCLGGAGAFGVLYVGNSARLVREAEGALALGRRQAEQHHFAAAVETLDHGLERLGDGPLREELYRARRRAARAHDAAALHERIERARYLDVEEFLPPVILRALEAQCHAAWEARDQLLPPAGEALDAETEEGIRHDLVDAVVLWSYSRVRLAAPDNVDVVRRDALRVLTEAEALLGPDPVLSRERLTLAAMLGAGTKVPDRVVAAPAPRTAWEYYAFGSYLLRIGDVQGAADAFDRAIDLRPQDFWPWFGKAVCAHRLQRFDVAVAAYSVCIALAPDCAVWYHNRARAFAAQGDTAAAWRDYNRALRLDPNLAAAALNRGALHLEEGRFTDAEADFRRAMALGGNCAAIHYNLALLHQARKELGAALACVERALEHDPGHGPSRDLRERLQKELSPTLPGPR